MGFALSVLYLFLYYLTPTTLLGPLAALHVELILAVLVVLVSVPSLTRAFIHKTAQSYALIGMVLAVFLSILIGVRWPGGAFNAVLGFIPNIFAYFLICLHCDSKKKLQVLVVMLIFVCVFVIAHGYADLLHVEALNLSPQTGTALPGGAPQGLSATQLWDMEHPYLLAMYGGTEEQIFRLRGLGDINDPNDFGQVIVCLIPLVFIFWRPKRGLLNTACVLLPAGILLFGVFLTHSRGALLAMLATAIMAARRRIGTIASLLLAGVMFAAAQALHFTGGRDISAGSGSDRTGLWGIGLELLKSHPLFGVGFSNFRDSCSCGHTAHNSIVVCAAELGLFGLFFWALFLFSTVRDALGIASATQVSEGDPMPVEETPFGPPIAQAVAIDKAEINRLGRLMVLSLTGFLVAALFLSRAYVLTLFLLGGMTEAIFEMALRRGMIAPRLTVGRTLPYAGMLTLALVLFMYVMVRVLNIAR
jgi:O-antigen ligase